MKAQSYDPRRSLTLLWGEPSQPGRSGLSLRKIVAAAVKRADRDGLDEVSMRHLAADLGVATMALYTHVPGKEELLDLIFDGVLGELYASTAPAARRGGWRAGMRFVAEQNWQLYRRHPWLLDIGPRPALGPHTVRKYDLELGPLDGIGLTFVEMNEALSLINNHVVGLARIDAQFAKERRRTGLSDAEWWSRQEPTLAEATQLMPYRLAARVGQAAAEAANGLFDPALALSFGLDRILDGLGVLIDGRAKKPGRKRASVKGAPATRREGRPGRSGSRSSRA